MAVFFRFLYVHDGHRVLSERSVDGPGLNVDLPFSFRLNYYTEASHFVMMRRPT